MGKFCISCGGAMVSGAKFCGVCGGGSGVAVAVEGQGYAQPAPGLKSSSRTPLLVGAIAGVVLVAVGVWVYASPYLALRNLKQVALSGDADALGEAVDFPALRASLKEEVSAQLARKTLAEAKTDGAAAFGSALAGGFVNVLIDQFVTPTVLARVAQGKKAEGVPDDLSNIVERFRGNGTDVDIATGYEAYDRFTVRIIPAKAKVAIALVLKRSGLGTWRLSALRLPNFDELPDAAGQKPAAIPVAAAEPEPVPFDSVHALLNGEEKVRGQLVSVRASAADVGDNRIELERDSEASNWMVICVPDPGVAVKVPAEGQAGLIIGTVPSAGSTQLREASAEQTGLYELRLKGCRIQ